MWAWMSAGGPGELVYLPLRFNGENYVQLLQDTMKPTVKTMYPAEEVPEILFIQDNCPIHTSRVVKQWFQQQPDFRTIQWIYITDILEKHMIFLRIQGEVVWPWEDPTHFVAKETCECGRDVNSSDLNHFIINIENINEVLNFYNNNV
ncbi:hypothetical protein ABMA28_011725 [Loxostege sticticalis]|uniref:Transposase n=1 Tax=Loxostege sticticalis TaxID=481309 RepID=A0ABD0TKJ9_LOXSC